MSLDNKYFRIVVIFVDKNWHDPRKGYAPDGTDLSGTDAKTMGEAAGIRWASYGAGSKWESSIGKFVDVGGGFLLHNELGMVYHDMAAVGDVPAQISGTSYGVFSNVQCGSQLL